MENLRFGKLPEIIVELHLLNTYSLAQPFSIFLLWKTLEIPGFRKLLHTNFHGSVKQCLYYIYRSQFIGMFIKYTYNNPLIIVNVSEPRIFMDLLILTNILSFPFGLIPPPFYRISSLM